MHQARAQRRRKLRHQVHNEVDWSVRKIDGYLSHVSQKNLLASYHIDSILMATRNFQS